jgi:hypothetical protein
MTSAHCNDWSQFNLYFYFDLICETFDHLKKNPLFKNDTQREFPCLVVDKKILYEFIVKTNQPENEIHCRKTP